MAIRQTPFEDAVMKYEGEYLEVTGWTKHRMDTKVITEVHIDEVYVGGVNITAWLNTETFNDIETQFKQQI